MPSECCQIFGLSSTRTVKIKFRKYFLHALRMYPYFLLFTIICNSVTIGLVKMSDDVGSMFEKMSRLLETVNDAQEKERLMIGMTGVPNKDILNRFVRTRFIPKLIASERALLRRALASSLLSSRVSLSNLSKSRRIYGDPLSGNINL